MPRRFNSIPKATPQVRPALLQLPAKFQQARTLQQRGQPAGAQFILEKILKLKPDHFGALNLLGMIAANDKKPARAAHWFAKAIAVDPDNALTHINRGSALYELREFDAALASYDRCISIAGNHAEAHFGRGNVLKDQGHWDAALCGYDRAIAIRSDYAEAHVNRGFVLKELKRLEEALASYDRAIAIRPDYAKAYCNRALTSLLNADFAKGWRDYEWREKRTVFPQPEWRGGESLAGKTILLRSEQGFGDTLQFCRYAARVSALGAKVILEVQKPLMTLLADLPGVSQIVARGSVLSDFDYQCALMSLPLAFKTCLDSIPCSTGYLKSDEGLLRQWRARLGQNAKPRIGLAWSGSPTNYNDRNRSIPLADLMRQLPVEFQYVGLQKEVREADAQTLCANPQVCIFADDRTDFSDAAAVCECLDLIVSVDTSIAHLGGALGKETWVLLPVSADWRWMLDRDDCPWYSSVKLYRQKNVGEWRDVLRQVRADLLLRFGST
jgi:tetratricopeptide (TPR) repeat protein